MFVLIESDDCVIFDSYDDDELILLIWVGLDCVFPAVHVPVLYDCLCILGDNDRSTLYPVSTMGQPDSEGCCGRSRDHFFTCLFFLCYHPQHCSAHFTLCEVIPGAHIH